MNYPDINLRHLKHLEEFASPAWSGIGNHAEAGKQAMKMLAALKMVLAFHSGEPWTPERSRDWFNLQVDAGREFPRDSATTKVLCNTIREVLGMQQEKDWSREP